LTGVYVKSEELSIMCGGGLKGKVGGLKGKDWRMFKRKRLG